MAAIINKISPKMFLFENVKGILSAKWNDQGKKGEIWKDVLKTFISETGDYVVKNITIYSKDYGVPQNRPRVFIIGIHRSLSPKLDDNLLAHGLFPEPKQESPPHLFDLLSDLVDENYKMNFSTNKYAYNPMNETQKIYRKDKNNNDLTKVSDHKYSKHKPHVEKKFTYMINNQIDHTAGQNKLPKE